MTFHIHRAGHKHLDLLCLQKAHSPKLKASKIGQFKLEKKNRFSKKFVEKILEKREKFERYISRA